MRTQWQAAAANPLLIQGAARQGRLRSENHQLRVRVRELEALLAEAREVIREATVDAGALRC